MDYQVFMGFLVFLSAIGGFLFGYDTGVVSGAMIQVKEYFELSDVWQELIVSATVGTAGLFSLVGAYLNDRFGRKPITLLASALFTVGAVVMGVAETKGVLLVGRLVVGVGLGLASMTTPMYIGEMAPAEIRGQLVTTNQIMITLGALSAALVDGLFSYDERNGWRFMLGLSGVPSLVQFFGFLFMPESPRYLITKRPVEVAAGVLARIRSETDFQPELDDLIRYKNEQMTRPSQWKCLKMCFSRRNTTRALVVGCMLQIIQQASGINTVMYYSASILQMAGLGDDQTVIWLAAVPAAANFAFSFIGLYLVQKMKRRSLTLLSLGLAVVGLLLMAGSFWAMGLDSAEVTVSDDSLSAACAGLSSCEKCIKSAECGFCYLDHGPLGANGSCLLTSESDWSVSVEGRCSNTTTMEEQGLLFVYDYCPSRYSFLTLLAMVFYLAAFSSGLGAMPWIVNSEIYPLWARSIGSGVSTACNWTVNLVVSLTFLTLADALTRTGAFLLYALLGALGWLFLLACLPESKGIPLEQAESLFEGRSFCVLLAGPTHADYDDIEPVTLKNEKFLTSSDRTTLI